MKSFLYLLSSLVLLNCDALSTGNTIYRPNSSNNPNTSTGVSENSEFSTLMEKDKINKKHSDAEVITYLLNETNPKDRYTAAVIENKSNCNIILRLVGTTNNKIYNLPILRNSKNQFVVERGNYTLKSKICGANYYSQKNISEPLILRLSSN